VETQEQVAEQADMRVPEEQAAEHQILQVQQVQAAAVEVAAVAMGHMKLLLAVAA
jgi:hypothetical protein